ncbi:uncharacterized protein LOC103277699 [Anolis carolinensis]|uniref:uncharacterized protein LOC103277699 n=1 Tax=Anolis carolinensis TaxID=28377 RepID=UPI000462C162|nr:PREDICTED: uncharacterized protein LOC103277699 [Anolis carolinensis]|eukprot:XP_008101748.1 PREDICTED: uncharacterized protein LOC103277699 [Anolis carolinensis]
MALFPSITKGLGQLEAYIEAEEGVAFQMDNDQFWASVTDQYESFIAGIFPKKMSCKFKIHLLSSGKVMLEDWGGMYLAVKEVEEEPNTFTVRPVIYAEDESLRFSAFHSGNKVAFQAYNGLFLTRVFRQFHVLEAVKLFTDESCLFRPLIGDLSPPTLKMLNIIPKDLSKLKFHPQLVGKNTYTNWANVPVKHTFTMTWEDHCTDKIIWDRLWGLGLPCLCSFTVERAKPTVVYTRDNDYLLSVGREISEKVTKEVEVPPRTKAVAHLFVQVNFNAPLPFTAVIQKTKPGARDETFNENGAWMGLIYGDLWVECSLEKMFGFCPVM